MSVASKIVGSVAALALNFGPHDKIAVVSASVRVRADKAPISKADRATLLENPFLQPPLFVADKIEDFEMLIRESDIGEDLAAEIRSRVQTGLSFDEEARARAFHDWREFTSQGFFFADEDLWRRLPKRFLTRYYEYRRSTLGTLPQISSTPRNRLGFRIGTWSARGSLARALQEMAKTPGDVDALEHASILLDGTINVLLNSITWPHLSERARSRILDDFISSEHGLDCRVGISEESMNHILDHFVSPVDRERIESDLRLRLLQRGRAFEIEIRELLSPFMAKRLDTMPGAPGPNCFNAGLNALGAADTEVAYTDPEDLGRELAGNYRFVTPDEALKFGDLLLYSTAGSRTKRNIPVHVATYLTPDLVFTKNGVKHTSPYVIQRATDVVKLYASDFRYRLTAFRRVGPGETPLGREAFEARHPYRYEHTALVYPHLGYDPAQSRKRRMAVLKDLSAIELGVDHHEELTRLAKDSRSVDVRKYVSRLLDRAIDRFDRITADDLTSEATCAPSLTSKQ